MRKNHLKKLIQIVLVSLFLSTSSSNPSLADPPPLPDDLMNLELLKNLFSFGVQCEGKSDLPHISRHKPGTVNVQARTVCPRKGVEITSRLTRIHSGTKVEVTKSNQGKGKTTVNVSLKCIWKKGMKSIRYEIKSVHRLSDGQIGYTYNYAEIEC